MSRKTWNNSKIFKSIGNAFSRLSFGGLISRTRVLYLEALYQLHLRIRYGHDALYHRSKAYKKYLDNPITSAVHKATIMAFVASFVIFTFMQYIAPNIFNLGNPILATAATNSVFASQETPSFSLDMGGLAVGKTQNVEPNMVTLEGGSIEAKILKGDKVQNVQAEITSPETGSDKFGIKLNGKNQFEPGKFTLQVTIKKSKTAVSAETERVITQDFTWGVLAINPDKAVYKPGEDASLAMAVLDDKGDMDCGAKVSLTITDPAGVAQTLTTDDKSIKVSATCTSHEVNLSPDYAATYKTGEIGKYTLKLHAETRNGTHDIVDSFNVEKEPAFEITRSAPTRIYPPNKYTTKLTIKAKTDFSGQITETVPSSFTVTPGDFALQDSADGKTITWDENLAAGEVRALSYEWKAPDISPQFYLMGPLKFSEEMGLSDTKALYEEPRQWQIAADATYHSQGHYINGTYHSQGYSTDIYHAQHNIYASSDNSSWYSPWGNPQPGTLQDASVGRPYYPTEFNVSKYYGGTWYLCTDASYWSYNVWIDTSYYDQVWVDTSYWSYSLAVTQGSNGTISPGTTEKNSGTSQTFTITPNTGYHIVSVTVDGSNQGVITSKAFTNVTADHSITAVYAVNLPTVTTSAATDILTTTATGNGNVTADGGATITERGVAWGTSANPTTGDSHTTASGTTGAYTASMTSLSANTHYHYRAYAVNSLGGMSYGADTEFDTAPNAPTGQSATAVSTTQMNVAWSAGAGGANHYHVRSSHDAYATIQYDGATTSWSETDLSANTSYIYRIYAVNVANVENTGYAETGAKYTLAVNPNITSDKTTNTWYSGSAVNTFTNAAGFGAGVVTKYKYVWDTTATHSFSGDGTDWSSSTIGPSMVASNSNYLHVQSYNGDNVASGTANYGPYYYDNTAPTTTGAITAGTAGTNGWYTTNVTYAITPADTGSGVASTVYCADTAGSCTPATAYTTALTISTESATNHVRFTSTDTAGNVQTVQDSGVIKIDKSLPTASSVASVTSNPNNSGNQTISWSTFSDGTGSGFASYTLQRKMVTPTPGSYVDVVPAFTDEGTLSYADNSNLAQGTYTYRVVVRDNANNSTASGDSTTVIVDKTAPTGTISVSEGLSTKESTIHLTLSTTDTGGANLASYDLSNTNDGSDWQTTAIANSPSNYSAGSVAWGITSGEGTKTIYVRYKDNTGTYSETYSDTIYNDTTPPTDIAGLHAYSDSGKSQDITANNTTTWYPYTSVYFEWDPSTAGSGISTYNYCFATSATCTPTTSTSGATNFTTSLGSSLDGTYYLRLVAVSNVLLESTAINTFQYNFDKSVPAAVTGFTTVTPPSPDTQVKLTWNAVPTNGGAPLANYRIERVEFASYPGLVADWSTLPGYAVYITTNLNFTDDTSSAQQGQPVIQSSIRYHYRISAKDQSNPDYGNYQANPLYSYTRDIQAPETPPIITPGQAAFACTASTCPAIDPLDASANTTGFTTKLTWTAAADAGSGVAGYKIYRTADESDVSWQVVGVLYTPTGLENTIWYDNDAHNDAIYGTDKTVASTRLNDSTRYYYRITAVDAATPSNETSLFPQGGDLGFIDGDQNRTSALTPDVTAPTIPVNVVTNPQGLDSTNEHQLINIQWGASTDYKARNTDIVPGTITYHLYRSVSSDGPWTNLITTTTGLSYDDEGLADITTYYYRVSAHDAIPNESALSALSESSQAVTYSSEVPGVPASTSVTTTKGDPSTDTSVGHTATISFTGSVSNTFQIVRYEVYRSTTNTTGGCNLGEDIAICWIRVNSATNVQTVNITPTPDDRGNEHTITDSGLTDATMYYYRVRAQDNNPAPGGQGNKYSGLTTIAAETIHAGWDITPDVTGPVLPSLGLDVMVKDTHPNEFELRNIVTWEMLTNDQLPLRNGVSDFAGYEVHREILDPADSHVLSDTTVRQEPVLGNNYYIDIVDIVLQDAKFKYYVTVVDNAGTDFRYATGALVNEGYSNVSGKAYWTDTIIPSKATPVLTEAVTLSEVGVSSAVVDWKTDQEADSLVQFRVKGSSDNWVAIGQIERTITHEVRLFGLSPSTEYEYQLVSRNYLGNNVVYDSNVLPQLKTTGFTITPSTVVTTTSTAEINWVTNLDSSSSFVEYQLQRQLGDDPQGGTSGVDPDALAASPRSHSVIIKGLRSNRTYTYKIKSISKDGYLAENPIGSFSSFVTRNFDSAQFTLDPASSNVADRNITSTTAQIVWQTATETTSWVDYGTAPGVYGISSGNDILTMTHVITIEGLIPGTKYYYHVRVKDSNELEFTSQEYSFTAVIKPKISNMQVKNVTPYSVTIAWDTNVDTETVLNWGKTTAYSEKHGTGGTSQVHQVTIDNLEDNTEYHYQIVAHDGVGNEVVGTDQIIRTPLDTEGPKISAVKLDVLPMGENDTTSSIIVSWQTNKPASTLVEYDEGVIGGSYKKSSIEDNTFNTSHTVIIKDLTPASSYHYRLVSRDKRANTTISQDYTFVTPSREKSILQLILKALEETFSWTRNLNQFFGNIMKRLTGR